MSDPTSTEPANVLSRSARFYHDIVIFEIEGVLYRVFKHGFVKYSQSFFRDLFDVPQGPGREGDSDESPIRAPQVTAAEFDSLLEVVYPLELTGPPSLSKDQWTGVLRLSRQWDMPQVAALAIRQLDNLGLSAMEKVKLGKAHGVPQWLKDGYAALVGDKGAASVEDLETLGLRTANHILYAQNQLCYHPSKTSSSEVYCGLCIINGYGLQIIQDPATGAFDSQKGLCSHYRCRSNPAASGYGAYTKLSFSDPIPLASQSVVEKVAEVFKDEIDEAERRNTLSPA